MARDAVLHDWKGAAGTYKLTNNTLSATKEAQARSRYFKSRADVESALQGLAQYEVNRDMPAQFSAD